MAKEPIDIFNQICQDINLKCIYSTNFIDNFNPSNIVQHIKSHHKIKSINIINPIKEKEMILNLLISNIVNKNKNKYKNKHPQKYFNKHFQY